MQTNYTAELNARYAIGRSWGAIFFSFFGGGWLLIALLAFAVAKPSVIAALFAGALLLIGAAIALQKRARKTQLGEEDEARKRDDRTFGRLNAVQWGLIFLVFVFFPRFGLGDWIFPALALIVGVHFFLMPPTYRRSSNFVVGSILCVLAIACPLLIKADPAGKTDPRIGTLALGSGLVLWANAVWALRGAVQHLRAAEFS